MFNFKLFVTQKELDAQFAIIRAEMQSTKDKLVEVIEINNQKFEKLAKQVAEEVAAKLSAKISADLADELAKKLAEELAQKLKATQK